VRVRLFVLLVFIGVGAIGTPSVAFASPSNQPASGSGSVGIRLIPLAGASPNDSLGSSYVVDRLAPGASLTRSVEIDNTTHSIIDVSVYPAAASIVRGSFAFAPSNGGNELSSWTSVSHDLVRLAPGAEALDTLTISAPAGASSGERYGVLWAQVSATPAAGGGVTLVNRVGVRMYVSIGPGGGPSSSFTVGPLTAERSTSGAQFVVAKVHNTGQSTLDITGNLALSNGPDGLRAGPFAATMGTVVAAGVSEPVTVQLDSVLPRGPWRADLSLTSGLLQHSAVDLITFPPHPVVAKARVADGFPMLLLVGITLLVMLGIAALGPLIIRRRIWRMGPMSTPKLPMPAGS
jgi:hypothetical protein